MGKRIAGIVTIGVLAIAAWAAWAVREDRARASAFELVATGQDRAQALKHLGQPDHAEPNWPGFIAYANGPCAAPCRERLWWESRLMPQGFEAWSVELDPTGRVLHKAHWVSP
ncbi:hypothetical protein GCM10027188_29360 [Lysobacter humi (ex Lee et al. 2017)]